MRQRERRSGTWVPGAEGSGFDLDNLPYGVVRAPGGRPQPAVRVGDRALDLAAVAAAGLLDVPGLPADVFDRPTLNAFVALGRDVWSATRARLTALLSASGDAPESLGRSFLPLDGVEVVMPLAIGDYVDGYASLEHASNVGRIFRPDGDPLTPNWRHMPIAYHGRAGTVVASGTPVRRPRGQRAPAEPGGRPSFGPERRLDVEVELGFVTGQGPALGESIAVAAAAEHIFGFVLVNDWSAREIQRWEYQPLGPFLGKSFATSISPWIVPLEALEPLRVPGPEQDPAPLDYLRVEAPWALDLALELAMAPAGADTETVVSRTNARGLYWNAAQQLAHATAGGATVRAGDLFASGTISGRDPGSYGSLLELSWGGRDHVPLAGGGGRTFLEDGDTVVIRGVGERGGVRISLGEVRGTVLPALRA